MDSDLFQKYLEHCVLFIQKVWKGYYTRRYFIQNLLMKYKRRRVMNAVVQGWKIRRILTGCREVIAIKRDLVEIKQMFGQTKGPKDPKNIQIMQQRKKKIEELCRVVPNLYKKGRWIFSLQKKLKVAQKKSDFLMQSIYSQSQIGYGNNNQNFSNKGTKSQYFNQIENIEGKLNKRNENNEEQLYHKDQKYQQQQPQYQFSNQQKYDKSPLQTQRSRVNYNDNSNAVEKRIIDFSNDINKIKQNQKQMQPQQEQVIVAWPSQRSQESVDSSVVLWPSQRQNPFQTTSKIQEDIFSDRSQGAFDLPFSQRTAVADKLQALDHNSIKPSQNRLQFRQEIENNQIQERQGWGTKPQINNYMNANQNQQNHESFDFSNNQSSGHLSNRKQPVRSPIKKKFQEDFRGVESDYDIQQQRNQFYEDEEEDFYEISNGYRKQNSQNVRESKPVNNRNQQNKYQYDDDQENEYNRENDDSNYSKNQSQKQQQKSMVNIDDIPIKPRKANPYSIEEMPLKQGKNQSTTNIDEIPIKPMKKLPVFDDQEFSNEERPIKTVERSYISNKNNYDTNNQNDSQIIPPKYNFEEMLEKAMLEQGEQLEMTKTVRQSKLQKRSKTVRPHEDDEDELLDQDNQTQPKKKVEKKENLKKRQKYDPRKAIEEAKKKQENDDQKPNKSAFPEGMLQPAKIIEDRIRPQTSKPRTNEDEDVSPQENNQKQPKRKTQKQAEKEKQEKVETQQYQYDESATTQDQSQTNTNQDKSNAPKNFLKRKTQAVKFQKCDWKVKSRIDCWTNKGPEQRSNGQSQTRRKTSALRSPKQENNLKSKQQQIQLQNQQQQQALQLQKIEETRIQPMKKLSQQQVVNTVSTNQPQIHQIQISQIQLLQQKQIQVQQQQQQPNITQIKAVNEPLIHSTFSQVPIHSINMIQQNQLNLMNQKSGVRLNQQQMPQFNQQIQQHELDDDTIEIESIPDENEQYEQIQQDYYNMPLQKSHTQQLWPVNNKINNQITVGGGSAIIQNHSKQMVIQPARIINDDEISLNPQDLNRSQEHYQQQQQDLMFMGGNQGTFKMQNYDKQFQQPQMSSQVYNQGSQNYTNLVNQYNQEHQQQIESENDPVTLQLEELEKVFQMFHPNQQSFGDCEIQDEITRDTLIPHLTMNSMFFNCYSDDIYDTILEDLRNHYFALCNE
ncbi:UNKNOWN [Stylonychia lemnae]|uniref:Uncharacterized protein n=1 Tax=Stylonychia lemnae TaxID=5949 RepID=A0A078AAQ5_STYLE|nr:UNKNOWN [Stylonychia lemnae]|eukprot:CDW78921.1 UNKNOWN [Stylonychia lemnae]